MVGCWGLRFLNTQTSNCPQRFRSLRRGEHNIAVLTTDQLLRLAMSGIVDIWVHSSVTPFRASGNREQGLRVVC